MKKTLLFILLAVILCMPANAITYSNMSTRISTYNEYIPASFSLQPGTIYYYSTAFGGDDMDSRPWSGANVTYVVNNDGDCNVTISSGVDLFAYGSWPTSGQATSHAIDFYSDAASKAYNCFPSIQKANATVSSSGIPLVITERSVRFASPEKAFNLQDCFFDFQYYIALVSRNINNKSTYSYAPRTISGTVYYTGKANLCYTATYKGSRVNRVCSVGSIESLSFPLNFC